jgi:hypothetical protein
MSKRVTPDEFDFEWFANIKIQTKNVGNPGTRRKIKYLDIVTAFDIETSKVIVGQKRNKYTKAKENVYQSFMYIWAWQFGEKYTEKRPPFLR